MFVRRVTPGLALLLLTAAGARAQWTPLSPFGGSGSERPGPHLYSLSGFASYYSTPLPPQQILYTGGTPGIGSDWGLGGGWAAGWSHPGAKSQFSIQYSGSYVTRLHYSELSGLNSFVSMFGSRRLNAKWTLGLSVNGSVSTWDQYLFTPTRFGSLTQIPATFDDLTSGVLSGKFGNDQLASLLTGAPIVESPARSLLYGNRVFNAGAALSLAYHYSPRLTFSMSGSGSRIQHLDYASASSASGPQYLVPIATSASAGVTMSYELTARTSFGLSGTSARTFSGIQDTYTTIGSASLGHKFGRRWFGQITGGGGTINGIRTTYAIPSRAQYVASGSLGYKTLAHTFLVNGSRFVGDTYAIGSTSTITATAAWAWQRPGWRWGLQASGARELMESLAFHNINGWRASAGFFDMLSPHLALEAQYSYLTFATVRVTGPVSLDQSGVRLSLTWYPMPRRPR